jgi:hypothetical protein
MPKLKRVPCLSCKDTLRCMRYLLERAESYDRDLDGGEDYNSESILDLGRECTRLTEFLFLDEVSFPSRSNHFFWWREMESKISESAWIGRHLRLVEYYDNILVPDSL